MIRLLFMLVLFGVAFPAAAATDHGTLAAPFEWPTRELFFETLLLKDYNTRVVTLGVLIQGLACGVIGPLLLLRKRSLMGDVLSHAAMPGIALAFIIMTVLGGSGKSLAGLQIGAILTSLLGVGTVIFIRANTRLKEDAALAVVLSLSFGIGVALLGLIQNMSGSNAAGLEGFIYGKTASMILSESYRIAIVAGFIVLAVILFFKEFQLLCFDQNYAASLGWPILGLDLLLMGLVVIITVVGMQAVGMILMVALLIIPAAAARFWTDRLRNTLIISGLIGAVSGWMGAVWSALIAKLPAGAVIVLVCGVFFGISFFFGTKRGVLIQLTRHFRFQLRIAEQNLLRAFYELLEKRNVLPEDLGEDSPPAVLDLDALMEVRAWDHRRQLHRIVRTSIKKGWLFERGTGCYSFTRNGMEEAVRVVRNHRLWEAYLIKYADIATSQVDHEADRIEHVLDPALVRELERSVLGESAHINIPGIRSHV
ncbi:MAG: iron chelate uptake ABC transporter family permease subunit [Pontiella sp.]